MAWIYLAASEETPLHSGNTSTRSLTVSKTDTLKRFFCPACKAEDFYDDPSGMMCGLCAVRCSLESTSSSGDFPAKTSALQDVAQAWLESEVDYFSRSCAWPKKRSPRSYSLRTSPPY